jgi:hypothetical protein
MNKVPKDCLLKNTYYQFSGCSLFDPGFWAEFRAYMQRKLGVFTFNHY